MRIKRVISRDKERNVRMIEKIIQNQILDKEAKELADTIIYNNEKSLLLPKVIKLVENLTNIS